VHDGRVNDIDKPLAPDELGERITEVYDLIGPLYRRAFRKIELGEQIEGASVGVRSVLDLLLRFGPMTVPQMGRIMALSRQFVQRTVNDAVARDWAEVIPNPAHQRSSLIRLTDAGRTVITAILAREHAVNRQIGGGLTGAEITACVRVLKQLLRTFDHVDVE
jgi:DNA-binding MarR family transcriptional regulator